MPEVNQRKIVLDDGSTVEIYNLVKCSNFAPEHLAEILTQVYNSFGSTRFDAQVAEALIGQHRTLQQCVIRGFVQILLEMGKKSWGTDLRNEAGIAFCKRLEKLVEEERVHLPLI